MIWMRVLKIFTTNVEELLLYSKSNHRIDLTLYIILRLKR
jgi:hypothetical protein